MPTTDTPTGELKPDIRAVVIRFARIAALTLIGLAAGFVVSPEVLELVGTTGAVIVSAVVVPALAALDKYLREKWEVKQVMAARRAAMDRGDGTPNVVHVHRIVETGETRPATPGEVEAGKVSRTLGMGPAGEE